ncbi:restriction endonuclease subunit S [Bavariicoccus seileri]|uniref:restriction endonuclease subunit S n=1 Tax=Bavariicoccus seileri TaxID=549685 RepID=UPI00047DC8A7|nr:restriction endonuclease subunit S [Bavariicoccus seileri]
MNDSGIYCLLKTDNFKQYALGYVNGTTVLHLSKKAIPQYKLPFPTDIKICKELSAILKTIMMKISLSDNENDNLNLTRDILLPKLMSGEIRVPLDEEGDVS